MLTRKKHIQKALLCCIFLVACSSPQPAQDSSEQEETHARPDVAEAREFAVADLKQRLEAGEPLFLLDVRRPEELDEHGAIAGYVNIPIDQLEARLSEVPKDRPVVTYCMRGGRASRAADILRKNGYNEDIQFGGITAWKEAGYPVEQPQPKPSEGQSEAQ